MSSPSYPPTLPPPRPDRQLYLENEHSDNERNPSPVIISLYSEADSDTNKRNKQRLLKIVEQGLTRYAERSERSMERRGSERRGSETRDSERGSERRNERSGGGRGRDGGGGSGSGGGSGGGVSGGGSGAGGGAGLNGGGATASRDSVHTHDGHEELMLGIQGHNIKRR